MSSPRRGYTQPLPKMGGVYEMTDSYAARASRTSLYSLLARSYSFLTHARSSALTFFQKVSYAFFASAILAATLLIASMLAFMLYAWPRMLSRTSHHVFESMFFCCDLTILELTSNAFFSRVTSSRKPSARIGPSDLEKPYVVVPFSIPLIVEALGPPGWYGDEIAGSPITLKMSSFENWPAFALAPCTAEKPRSAAPPRAKSSRREVVSCISGDSTRTAERDCAGTAGATKDCEERAATASIDTTARV